MSTPSCGPEPDEVAAVASVAAELLEVLWGRASTAPVSPSQLRVLFVLEHHEGISLRAAAEALGSGAPSVSRLCDRLEAVGYVERAQSSRSRRELRLALTRRGRQYLHDLRIRREAELRQVVARMPPARRAALVEGLRSFSATASLALDLAPGPSPGERSA